MSFLGSTAREAQAIVFSVGCPLFVGVGVGVGVGGDLVGRALPLPPPPAFFFQVLVESLIIYYYDLSFLLQLAGQSILALD